MTVYEYAKENDILGLEITLFDEEYDIEFYAYPDDKREDDDLFDEACNKLWKLLEVKEVVDDYRLVVNFSKIVNDHLAALRKADLFIRSDIDSIMDCMPGVISGNVPEYWMASFVEVLCS